MRRAVAASVVLIIAIVLAAVLLVNQGSVESEETVYVGVAYCGDSVADGKLLIDKVKHYTNLFVLQSGSLQRDLPSVDELGDYAVSAGLYFLPYFGYYIEAPFSAWLETAKQKWGTHLLGVYYGDEPAGKMLDDYVEFDGTEAGDSITKTRYGDIVVEKSDGVVIHYEINGVIHLFLPNLNSISETGTGVYTTFYANGTVEIDESSASAASADSLPSYANYDGLMSLKPFKDVNETAERFVARNKYNVDYLSNATTVFTSDYALYWWDYLSGYDVVLEHMGWNHSVAQQIALTRGAATLQNKDWGVVVTWKYNVPPYLDTGEEILSQMRTAYECGAKYFVLFDYYEGNDSPYGTMQDEHFAALESFWNDVVKNPSVVHGSIKADSVLVLPENYGWGMRWLGDKIWGIFEADDKAPQIWELMQSALKDHELTLDIVYEDADFPLPLEYRHVYYWNQN
jgi:hypothetical protein